MATPARRVSPLYYVQPLKKVFSILLLTLLLFNLFGYKMWFYYLQEQSEQQLITSLDKNEYNDADLVTIKVPITLPYFKSWSDFERYDGSIEIDGQHYNYVKRKVCNDTLVLLCIPNIDKSIITNAQTAYESLLNNGHSAQNNKAGETPSILKLLMSEYSNDSYAYSIQQVCSLLKEYVLIDDNRYCPHIISSPWQPPDVHSQLN